MTAAKQQYAKTTGTEAAIEQTPKKSRPRGKDSGPDILPHLEHFVLLTRKVQRPELIGTLVECANGESLPMVRSLTDGGDGSLPIVPRNAVFTAVASLPESTQRRIEHAAERVNLLIDEFGTLAVGDLLDAENPDDAEIIEPPTDKFSRALYLYLCQEYPPEGSRGDNRFDHAEARQLMLQQSQSEKYSSLYLGPKGVQPKLDGPSESDLRQRLTVLFPKINADDILVERYEIRDQTLPGQPVILFTLTAAFNGKHVHYKQVANGAVEERDEPAMMDVRFSWQPGKGDLAVFCDDEEVRPELAALFRDVVLGGNGDIRSMPIRKFVLMGFCTPAMLARLKKDRIDGIESIDIKNLVVAKPEYRQVSLRGKTDNLLVENALVIRRDRFDDRNIYDMADQVHHIGDLTEYVVKQTRLTMRIAKTSNRKAHNISVLVAIPNGYNERKLTKHDNELVLAQLKKLDCVLQY